MYDPQTGAYIPDAGSTPAGGSPTTAIQPTVPIMQAPTYTPGQNFSFDPNTLLPGVQQQAASIYDPQKAQIDALNKISQAQTANTKITTEKQFQDELTARIEAINARGAFFGGGAIVQQNDLGERKTSALTQIDLQQQAADLATQAQQAGLNVAQQQYIQDKITGAQGSAYSMWNDAYGKYQDQIQNERANKEFELQQRAANDAHNAAKKKKKKKK